MGKKLSLALMFCLVGAFGAQNVFSADPAPAAGDATAKLYQAKCASCHGKDGKGNPAMSKALKIDMAALSVVGETTIKKEDKELDAITADGKGKMPAYKGKISAAEISALTAYIRTLAPKPAATEGAPAAE